MSSTNIKLDHQCTMCYYEPLETKEFPCSLCVDDEEKPYYKPKGVDTYGISEEDGRDSKM